MTQRVVLYDEDPSDPKGKQYVGSVIWRTEPIKASGNQKADIAVRADIEIPDRKLKMTMSFRRNTDTSLPASHTAELTFMPAAGFFRRRRRQRAGHPDEVQRAGARHAAGGYGGESHRRLEPFLVGLSNVDAERARNVQLLKERSWFDVPLVYANQRRAIIAIEKGAPGERAFNEAFAAWGEYPAATTVQPEPATPKDGGYLAQVSSQKNEADAQASYRALQNKFPTCWVPVAGDQARRSW